MEPMCGRFKLNVTWRELVRLYRLVTDAESGQLPLGEVRPTDQVPVILNGSTLAWMRWGWPPSWAAKEGKDPWRSPPIINARIEEAAQKPLWAGAWRRGRCLVPMTGFLEWEKDGKERLPNLFGPTCTVAFGGLWGEFPGEHEVIRCVAILTRGANAVVSPVHDRMPVMLAEAQWSEWLDPSTPAQRLLALAEGIPEAQLQREPLGTRPLRLF